MIVKKPVEKNLRSLTKSVTYRIVSICIDSTVAYLFTRNVALSFSIVLFVNGYSTVVYYLHERLWARIPWGRKEIEQRAPLPVENPVDN